MENITNYFRENYEALTAEVELQRVLNEAFPNSHFEVTWRKDKLIVSDLWGQRIEITGADDDENPKVESTLNATHSLQQAAAYLWYHIKNHNNVLLSFFNIH